MKSIIYTFENKKPVFFEKPRFYKIKSRSEYAELIEEFLAIDAVTTPYTVKEVKKYPIYLELKSGFTPEFKEVSKKYIKKQIKKAKKILK